MDAEFLRELERFVSEGRFGSSCAVCNTKGIIFIIASFLRGFGVKFYLIGS